MRAMVVPITSEELNRLVHGDRKAALVLFTGKWCPDCTAFAPLWRRWTAEHTGPMYSVEVARGAPEWDDWEIDEIPSVVAYSAGVERDRSAGSIQEKDLDRLMEKVAPSESSRKGSSG